MFSKICLTLSRILITKRALYSLFAALVLSALYFSFVFNGSFLKLVEAATYTAGVTSKAGTWMDSDNENAISATQVTTGANPGTLSKIKIYVDHVQRAPKNHMQVAIYSDNGSDAPGTLLASSGTQTLTLHSWNTFNMSSISISANTKYWLAFNVDGRNTRYAIKDNVSAKSAWRIPTTYGTWPSTFGTPTEPITGEEYSIHMLYDSIPTPTPTATPTPTPGGPQEYTAGYQTWDNSTDGGNNGWISSTQITTGANSGISQSITVYMGNVGASPNNHMQVGIYADNGSNAPGSFLGSSSSVIITPNTWNTVSLTGISIAASTKYWLAFEIDSNDTRFGWHSGTGGLSRWKNSVSYGTWPSTFGTPDYATTERYAIYLKYVEILPTATPTPTSTPTPTATPTPTPTPTPAGPDFPQLGGMLIGNPHNFDEEEYQEQIAKLDVAVLGMYNGWGSGGKTPAQAVNEIKALNPNILLGNYTIMTEITNNSSDSATAHLRTKLESEVGPNSIGDWWAYDENDQHTDWSGGAYDSWDANLTDLVTPDANGETWASWKATDDYEKLIANANWDFWYSDNNMWKPRVDADWDRDGDNDSQDDIAVRNWWRDGQRDYYDRAIAITSSSAMMVMVNSDSDLNGTVYPSDADNFTQYEGIFGGAFMEHTMGKDWSVESWGGWDTLMGWYRELKSNLADPQLVFFDVFLPETDDYQYFRYAFATSLMDNSYFSASTDYNEIVWFDEYDLAGTDDTKWLGKAIDGPQTSAWQNGVYRRNFENGTVLVNPKGNGQQTVTIGSGYHRFEGNQDPTVNNGDSVTSTVTLQDRDGLFLVKD